MPKSTNTSASASSMVSRSARVAGLGAVVLLALVGCSRFTTAEQAPAGNTQAAPGAPAAPGQPNANTDATTQVLTAYRGYWNSAVTAWTQGNLDARLADYAKGQADSQVRATLQTNQAAGLVTHGRPVLDPSAKVNLSTSPYTATVTDCIDETDFYNISKSTGTRAPGATPGRHPAEFQARYESGGWYVVSGSVDLSHHC